MKEGRTDPGRLKKPRGYPPPRIRKGKMSWAVFNHTIWGSRGGSIACSPALWSSLCSGVSSKNDRQSGGGGTWPPWPWHSGPGLAAGRHDTRSHGTGGSGPRTEVCLRARRSCRWQRGCSTPTKREEHKPHWTKKGNPMWLSRHIYGFLTRATSS